MRLLRPILVIALTALLLTTGIPTADRQAWAVIRPTELSWTVHGQVWESNQITSPITMVALTWAEVGPEAAWFRVRREGRWTPWSPLPIEDEHGPDPATAEARRSRPGSDAVWVGPSQAVQFRAIGPDPSRVSGVLIDTTDRTKPTSRRLGQLLAPKMDAAGAIPDQPLIRPRSDWDPANECAPRDTPDYVQVTHAFVHHTTGANDYSLDDVPSRILAICLYHLGTRAWDDIGYNFLIDRFGQIWEGRAGGIDKGVQGAHTAGFNSYGLGVAFIGDHRSTGPSPEAEAALAELLAWKFGVHNVEPVQSSTLVSKGSDLWPEGTKVSLRPISGHRDAQSTTCPGEACYQRLPSYRSAVDAVWSQVPLGNYRSALVGDFDGDGEDEGAVFRTTDGVWNVIDSDATPTPWADFYTAKGWSSQVVGDFDGDGRDDIANFHPSNGTWWVSRSTGTGFTTTLWADFSTASGWSRQVVGDFDGDGRDDIANFHPSNGTWWVSRSTGTGFTTTLWADFSTASGWTIQLVGDFNGDGRDDIANRHVGNGSWWVSISDGSAFTTTLWGYTTTYDHLSLSWVQDVDSDGNDDVLAFDAYNGFIRRQKAEGDSFLAETLIDTPWRTTLASGSSGPRSGASTWVFFGQEFQWVRITGLDLGAAGAEAIFTMPRS